MGLLACGRASTAKDENMAEYSRQRSRKIYNSMLPLQELIKKDLKFLKTRTTKEREENLMRIDSHGQFHRENKKLKDQGASYRGNQKG